jgi:Na+-transporting NADH:ubiquinone oxidoreductase subunit NqrA
VLRQCSGTGMKVLCEEERSEHFSELQLRRQSVKQVDSFVAEGAIWDNVRDRPFDAQLNVMASCKL